MPYKFAWVDHKPVWVVVYTVLVDHKQACQAWVEVHNWAWAAYKPVEAWVAACIVVVVWVVACKVVEAFVDVVAEAYKTVVAWVVDKLVWLGVGVYKQAS